MNLHWISLALAIITSMGAQTLLKSGAGRADFIAQLFDWRTMFGLVCYGGAAMFYILALRRIPMSVALPCTAASYIVIALIGHFVFGEALGLRQIGGIVLISSGVLLLAFA
jgi:multidrug transporter EmrE-like cation transporter